ncbi:MAG: sulfurtransferase-like selenium metabolism protein YedF [Desulfuromonadaceae bacterium]|nr:sulfurtransferase-like selenium metabolism protein YedF [Desulfuromonadaceae bacterium]MDD5105188.1 sulfurtransferase-like selenium metabolism protein YedF [Desulfuromonadaceae bacterium]
MAYELDCRGMNCPAPVLRVRDALAKEALDNVMVLVDNDAARQNVSRFLEHQGFRVNCVADGDNFRVGGTRDGTAVCDVMTEFPAVKVTRPDGRKIMVLVTSSTMGRGDDGLGEMLMFNFLKTLKEMGPDLWRVTFVNSGVSFTAEGSEAVPILRELADSGVKIMACGACLVYFHILDKLQVGEVTNMLEIVTGMKGADSVVTI